MKLVDLFEYTFPKIQYVTTTKPPVAHADDRDGRRHVIKRKGTEHLGSGTFASAYHDPKQSPHEVRKVSKEMHERKIDGFYYYIKELENNPDNDNPYYPRFSAIKIYKKPEVKPKTWSTGAYVTYSAQMEKLYNIRELKASEKQYILSKLHGESTIDQTDHNKSIVSIVRDQMHGDGKATDPHFIRAIEFINKVASEHSYLADIHDDNIMFRRTPYGPQLVITDPLGYRSGGSQ